MNILLIGECYSENLGDAIICQTVSRMIEKQYPEANITFYDISGRIGYQKYFELTEYLFFDKCLMKLIHQWPQIFSASAFCDAYKKDELRYLRSMMLLRSITKNKKFDLAIFAGGAMLMDYFAGLIYFSVGALTRRGVPVIFHSCGMGALSEGSIRLLRKVFQNRLVRSVSLRDSLARFQETFGDLITPKETFDTALCCSDYFEKASSPIAEYGIGIIGFETYFALQTKIVRAFMAQGIPFKVFTNGSPMDERMANAVLKDCGYSDAEIKAILLPRPLTPETLVHHISGFDKIVSFRMHSLIVATSFGIESHGLAWDNKVHAFYEKLGKSQWCYCTDEEVRQDLLLFRHGTGNDLETIVANTKKMCYSDLSNELSNVLT